MPNGAIWWVWDQRLSWGHGGYRDTRTGRTLEQAAIRNVVNGIVDRTDAGVTDTLADMLADRRLSVNDWHAAMGRAIKNAYVQQAELAAGGRAQMTAVEWGVVGGTVREQYGHLRDFAQEIAQGKLSEAQIRRRARMYVNSSREAYWNIRDRKERERGMTQERWVTMGDDTVCDPCIDAGAMDWQEMGTFAQPGSGRVLRSPATYCRGLTNCRCEKEYR